MKKAERVLVLCGLAVGLALAIGVRLPDATPLAGAHARTAQPAGGVATVDTFEVMTRLFQSSRYQGPRDAKVAELNAILQPLRTELEELARRYESLPENSPERGALLTTGQAKNQDYQQRQQELSGQMDAYVSEQIGELFALVARTAQGVAAAKGLGVVISSAPPGGFKIKNANEAMQEVLRRPVLHGAVDITADVLKELLPDEPAPAPPPRP
jgi:Skp family chaperone for outer membrane proteins